MIHCCWLCFAGWSLWLIFTAATGLEEQPGVSKEEQELREQPVDGSNNLESDGELSKMLLQHVNSTRF